MRTIATFLLACTLCLTASAQVTSYVSANDDIASGTSMQMYFDFFPTTAVGGIPPLTPAVEDALIIFDPLPDDVTSNSFMTLVSNELNDYFRKLGMNASAQLRERGSKGESAKDATISITAGTGISAIFVSPDSLTPPSTELTESPGISVNPFLGNRTRLLTSPFPGTPNSQLLINDQNPNDDVTHEVEVFAPGPLKFTFSSGTNPFQPVTFMISNHYTPENIPAAFVSFPGSLDIGTFSGGSFQNITFIADGNFGGTGSLLDNFFRTNASGILDFQVSLGLTQVGNSIAAQAIIGDPVTAGPIPYAFTQAANIQFSVGFEQTLMLGDNGSVPVPFIQGTTFDFYGMTYTAANVSANGYVSFGGPLGVPNDAIVDPGNAVGQSPAIFANWSDWDTTGLGVTVRQFGAELRINWGTEENPITDSQGAKLGAFTTVLHLDVPLGVAPPSQREAADGNMSIADEAGSVFIDTLVLGSNGPTAVTLDGLIGISPGNAMSPVGIFNRSFDDPQFPNVGNLPILSQHDGDNLAASTLPVASGGVAIFNNAGIYEGRSIGFFPTTIMGQPGFNIIADNVPRDDLQGADISTLSAAANAVMPINFNLVGYLRYLFSFNTNQLGPFLELVDSATLNPIAPLTFNNLMTPAGASDAGTSVAAPTTIPVAPTFKAYEGVGVTLPIGSLAGVAPGTLLRVRIIYPDGTVLISRQVISVM